MGISIRTSELEKELFKQFALAHNMTVSELFRSSVLEKISTSYDKEIYGIEVKKKLVMTDNKRS